MASVSKWYRISVLLQFGFRSPAAAKRSITARIAGFSQAWKGALRGLNKYFTHALHHRTWRYPAFDRRLSMHVEGSAHAPAMSRANSKILLIDDDEKMSLL